MLKVLSVVGTRPEAIKMAPVVRELGRRSDAVESRVCSTGQHRELLDPVFELFGIRPDRELGVMESDQALARLTGRLVERLDALLVELEPDWVLAQGDTTTVLAASLVAFYRQIPFGHVEAGLRTGDWLRPFPEEANRFFADRLSALQFAPTERARAALLAEGADDARIVVTGNTVIDALQWVAALPHDASTGPLASLPRADRLVLVTAHRRESFGAPFRRICRALAELADRFAEAGVHFVYPVHPNPNVREPAFETLGRVRNLTLLDPLDYLSMVHLMKRSTLILTDSGGLQEEGAGLGVPVLVMRDATERQEGIEAGTARLVGSAVDRIVSEVTALLTDPAAHAAMATRPHPYGDGKAARRIVDALLANPQPGIAGSTTGGRA